MSFNNWIVNRYCSMRLKTMKIPKALEVLIARQKADHSATYFVDRITIGGIESRYQLAIAPHEEKYTERVTITDPYRRQLTVTVVNPETRVVERVYTEQNSVLGPKTVRDVVLHNGSLSSVEYETGADGRLCRDKSTLAADRSSEIYTHGLALFNQGVRDLGLVLVGDPDQDLTALDFTARHYRDTLSSRTIREDQKIN